MFRRPAAGMASPRLLFFFQVEQNYPAVVENVGDAQSSLV